VIISINEVHSRLSRKNILLVGEYINVTTKTEFKCYCGKVFKTTPCNIFSGHTTSCGCYGRKIKELRLINLSGQKFGKLRVISILPRIQKMLQYLCECDCGKVLPIFAGRLTSGNTKSCGCYRRQFLPKGVEHPAYNKNLTEEDRIKKRIEIKSKRWSKQIFERDNYICQKCYIRGGKLNAHHLDGHHWCEEKRLDLTNGITLCEECHKDFHKLYGKKNNTKEQFLNYKSLKE
jgi:hypothetical protein